MKELAVFINQSGSIPVYEQIYEFIKKEIREGNIKTGERLPSTRNMSSYLQVSRSTVLASYEQLLAEGYIEARERKGYYVIEIEKDFADNHENTINNSKDMVYINPYTIDFSPNGIETEHFPVNEWRKISKNIFTDEMKNLFNSGDKRGDDGLREQLAVFLQKSRGVKADKSRIILGAGNENLLMLIKLLLPGNVIFAVENPVYKKSYDILRNFTDNVIPVGLDKDGLSVKELEKSNADVAYLTPSHQYPLGIVMGIKRRVELLNWASRKEDRYIIEDDYDSEFRYKGRPIPSLQSIDNGEKVIYMGTFSKSVTPAIRMSYMVLPKKLMDIYMKKTSYIGNTVSRIDQKYMEIFMKNGGFERHLNRMRTIYKAKHDVMLNELKTWKNINISGENAGVHIILEINNNMTEKELVKRAAEEGVKVYPLSDYYIGGIDNRLPGIIIGYSKLCSEKIINGLRILKKVWKIEEAGA